VINVVYNHEPDGVVCPECRTFVSGVYVINAGCEGIFLCFECMKKLAGHLAEHIKLVENERGVIA